MTNDDLNLGEIAEREDWPLFTIGWRGRSYSVLIPLALFEDPPALAAFLRFALKSLAAEAAKDN